MTVPREPEPAQPETTRTFLFADLRDYTAFVERYGDAAAADLIAKYRRLVREQIVRSGGGEIKTEGDSFYVVFSSARRALECGVAILRGAAGAGAADASQSLRIGIGIHAGEPITHEGQFVGSAVNVAARLAQSAGPGELLLSDVVRGLLRTSSTRPITERIVPLKGIAEPFRAFAVRWEDDVLARPQPVVARRRRPGRAYRRPTIWLAAFVAASVIVATAGLYRTAVAPRNSLVTVAGLGTEGDSGDGGPAVAAQLGELSSLGFDAERSLYLADTHVATTRIRRVDRRGIIVTVAAAGPLTW